MVKIGLKIFTMFQEILKCNIEKFARAGKICPNKHEKSKQKEKINSGKNVSFCAHSPRRGVKT